MQAFGDIFGVGIIGEFYAIVAWDSWKYFAYSVLQQFHFPVNEGLGVSLLTSTGF